MKSAIKRIPNETFKDRGFNHEYFDVEMKNEFVAMYPRNAKAPLNFYAKTLAFVENNHSILQIGNTKYLAYRFKGYSEKNLD